MTTIHIKEDIELPKNEFQNLEELFSFYKHQKKLTLLEYLNSVEYEEDERTVFESGEEFANYLKSLRKSKV